MDPDFQTRCEELIKRGQSLALSIRYFEGQPNFWFPAADVPELQAWIASSANLFRLVATPDTYFFQEATRIVEDKSLADGIPYKSVQKLIGLLQALLEEMKHGLMRKAEYIFVASTFDDFLDHAAGFHKNGKKVESAVLASVVFEDSIRRFASKMQIEQAGRALEILIDDLVKAGAITPVKGKRWKSYAGVRNSALHAQWDAIDLSDIGSMIKGVKEIVELL